MTAISIIAGVYNVREYLPRFIQSLQEQTFKDFEVLFVDDASTDDSAAILEAAASGDKRFSLLRQAQNSGVGAARNAGIRAAQGETLCFADPDDLLPPESLEVRYAAFKKHNTLVRACHKEIAADGQLLKHEARPPLAEVCIPRQEAGRIGVTPFLCAHWTWLFPTNMLRRCNIFHGENMRTADDIFMLAKLFFHIPKLIWLPDVVYHWMKRPESLSTTHYTYAHYADYLHCVDVFYEEAQKNQAIGLGDRFCNEYLWAYLAHCIRQGLNGQSTEEDAHRLVSLAADICGRHKTFTRFPENAARTARHVGLFMLRHVLEDDSPLMIQRLLNGHNAALDRHAELRYGPVRQNGWLPAACDKYDSRQRLLRVRYLFCGEHPEERFTHAGRPLQPAFAKNRLEYQGKDFSVFERIVWLPVPPCEDGPLEVLLNGREAASTHTPAAIRRAFTPSPPGESDLPVEARSLREFAASPAADRFRDVWLFIDRDTEADDNAEHLYRWVMRHHPEINAWFVLAEDSHDWPRLQAEGFKLAAHGSMEHKILFIVCKNLISSQMDRYIFALLEEKHFADLRDCRFVSLQHGVTKEDMSSWLNTVDMDLFVTATKEEHHSIVDGGTRYALTEKEVVRTGFPRHDSLREAGEAGKNIFIMPTWRANLAEGWDGQRQKDNPNFSASSFVQTWRQLLSSPALAALCRTYGCEAIFWPHRCFRDYLTEFNLPAYVRIPAGEPIQTLLKNSGLLITDYSSIAFDMAVLRRPVLYYHFENYDQFLATQGRQAGYFQYDRDGFGPVCRTREELLAALERVLAAGCQPEPDYLGRMERTLDLNDGQCCRRTFEAIMAVPTPFLQE